MPYRNEPTNPTPKWEDVIAMLQQLGMGGQQSQESSGSFGPSIPNPLSGLGNLLGNGLDFLAHPNTLAGSPPVGNPLDLPQSSGEPFIPGYPSNAIPGGAANLPNITRGLVEGLVPTDNQPKSYEDTLLEQLTALANQGSSVDTEGLLGDLTSGINQAFGGQVAGIRHQMQGARADTKEGTHKIQAMYRALAKDMRRAGRAEAKQSSKLAQQLERMGAGAAQSANQQASGLLNQNAEAAAALGAPELMAKLNTSVSKQAGQFGGQAIQEANRAATGQAGLGAVARRFFNTAGGTSRIEGTQRASDLIGNLQDYLQGSRDKIGEIQGQKAMALAQAKADMLQQIAGGDSNQQKLDNLLKIANLKMAMDQQQAELQSQGPDLSKLMPEGLYNSGALLNQFSQSSPEGPAVANLFSQLTTSPEFMQGYVPAPQGAMGSALQLTNPSVMMQLIKQYAGDQNLSPAAVQTLLSALLEYASGIKSTAPGYLPGS